MSLDVSIGLGLELAYGDPENAVTSVRGFEGRADSWKTSREYVESTGFRAETQTARADRRNIVEMGGEGELELALLDGGMGALFSAAFDRATVTAGGAGKPVTGVYETAASVEPRSYVVEVVRPATDGARYRYRHHGAVVTELELSQEVGDPLLAKASFDFQRVTDALADTALPVRYPTSSRAYDWTDGYVELTCPGEQPVRVPVTSWSVSLSRGLKTDRRHIRGSAYKAVPARASLPEYGGSLQAELTRTTHRLYQSFTRGEVCALRIVYGPNFTVELPAVQMTGNSPEASLDDLTSIELEYRALDPGDGRAAARLTYVDSFGDDPREAAIPPESTPDEGDGS
ncbi:hypothetical protein GCM10012275_19270 [Longimycelium tulufanense]|uniref:Tail protein n=1 Tax=Longimycelium tulufanense TaxID=907463 RepID=A0A8J3CCF2_9PSEU|nr:phage tail tube protein [Longimycelium tulufanense]GGM48447.1 hypothetical protein GCM10012275_19270 [Longimycelium tulufanense]